MTDGKPFPNYRSVECLGCVRGMNMCTQFPCIGTIEEIKKLIDEGHADKLMIDRRYEPTFGYVEFLMPAIKGREKQYRVFSRGKCVFLTDQCLCSIHHMKPLEGRYACCKDSVDDKDNAKSDAHDEMRFAVFRQWATQEGQELLRRWKDQVGCNVTYEVEEKKYLKNDLDYYKLSNY